MSVLVVDTNVVSFLMKDDSRGEPYRRHFPGNRLAISFMTVAELYEGAFRAGWGERRFRDLVETLKGYVIVPYSLAMCECWGRIRAERRAQPISPKDAWVAVTAVTCGCPLVTHNPRDFEGISGLTVITELES